MTYSATTTARGRRLQMITIVLFVGLLFFFGLFFLVAKDRPFSERENRYLAQFPSFSREEVFSGETSRAFENYVNDQFPLRDRWIVAQAALQYASGRKDNNGVYYGESLVQTFWGYDEATLRRNLEAVEAYAKSAQESGEAVYFLPIPNAVALAQGLPRFAPDIDQERLLAAMREGAPSAHFVDVLGSLREKRTTVCRLLEREGRDGRLYYRTDHHLTMLGSYAVYRRLCEEMDIAPLAAIDFEMVTVKQDFTGTLYNKSGAWWTGTDRMERWERKGGAALTVRLPQSGTTHHTLYNEAALTQPDVFSYYAYGNQPVLVVRSEAADAAGTMAPAAEGNEPEAGEQHGRKLLIIKDSYAHEILSLLACHFEEIHMIDLRYYHKSIAAYKKEHGLDTTLILYNVSNFTEDKDLSQLAGEAGK